MFTAELLDLKTALQCTLTRLSTALTTSEDDGDHHCPSRAAAPTTARATASTGHERQDLSRPWPRHELRRKVAAASTERRALERQLQHQRQTLDAMAQKRRTDRRRRTAWQRAMAQLQEQQTQIRQELERVAAGTDVMERQGAEADGDSCCKGIPMVGKETTRTTTRCVDDTLRGQQTQTYSIGGVVTLEPLARLKWEKHEKEERKPKQQQTSARRVDAVAWLKQNASFGSAVVEEKEGDDEEDDDVGTCRRDMDQLRRLRCSKRPPDALTDVFLLQLKFAETMLKLEKSVQMRDQLLRGCRTTSRTGTPAKAKLGQDCSCCRQARWSSEREGSSDESVSSSSLSSLKSTPSCGQKLRTRCPDLRDPGATIAEKYVPSSLGADNSPSPELAGVASMSSITTPPHDSPEESWNSDCEHDLFDGQESQTYETPTTGSSGTTPTTGSDQKSASSMSKQVRFGNDAYSTPVLARKFNFDGPSVDDDDDGEEEEHKEESESILSFLGGSVVSSTELNEVSFLRAFEHFRRELHLSELTNAPVDPSLVRKLFAEPHLAEPDEPNSTMRPVIEGAQDSVDKLTIKDDGCDDIATVPGLAGLSIPELQERRRQLCLDIQAASAQLVLNSGRMLDVTRSPDVKQTRDRLMSMRDDVKLIDARLSGLQ